MESRRIAVGAVLLTALLVFLFNSSVSSCVPDDFGKCEKVRERVRISWLGGGGKNNATLILAQNQNTLKNTLLDFAKSDYNTSAITGGVRQRRAPDVIPLRHMTDAELEQTAANLVAKSHDESLNQVRRLGLVAKERERRVLWRSTFLAQLELLKPKAPLKPLVSGLVKTAGKVSAKPAPAPLHVPEAPKPGSADPFNAPAPSGAWFHLGPHESVWYNVSDRGRRLNIWMDADPNSGLVLAIYGPDVADVWNGRPTGQAAPGGGRAYFWTGRSRFKGIWRIRITNPNDYSVPYSLTAANIADKNGDLCRDCHGIIEDEWERCEHDGSFCEDLKDEFAN